MSQKNIARLIDDKLALVRHRNRAILAAMQMLASLDEVQGFPIEKARNGNGDYILVYPHNRKQPCPALLAIHVINRPKDRAFRVKSGRLVDFVADNVHDLKHQLADRLARHIEVEKRRN